MRCPKEIRGSRIIPRCAEHMSSGKRRHRPYIWRKLVSGKPFQSNLWTPVHRTRPCCSNTNYRYLILVEMTFLIINYSVLSEANIALTLAIPNYSHYLIVKKRLSLCQLNGSIEFVVSRIKVQSILPRLQQHQGA